MDKLALDISQGSGESLETLYEDHSPLVHDRRLTELLEARLANERVLSGQNMVHLGPRPSQCFGMTAAEPDAGEVDGGVRTDTHVEEGSDQVPPNEFAARVLINITFSLILIRHFLLFLVTAKVIEITPCWR